VKLFLTEKYVHNILSRVTKSNLSRKMETLWLGKKVTAYARLQRIAISIVYV